MRILKVICGDEESNVIEGGGVRAGTTPAAVRRESVDVIVVTVVILRGR